MDVHLILATISVAGALVSVVCAFMVWSGRL